MAPTAVAFLNRQLWSTLTWIILAALKLDAFVLSLGMKYCILDAMMCVANTHCRIFYPGLSISGILAKKFGRHMFNHDTATRGCVLKMPCRAWGCTCTQTGLSPFGTGVRSCASMRLPMRKAPRRCFFFLRRLFLCRCKTREVTIFAAQFAVSLSRLDLC